VSKETCAHGKRDLLVRQKRPTEISIPGASVKRDLYIRQKRRVHMPKETCAYAQRGLCTWHKRPTKAHAYLTTSHRSISTHASTPTRPTPLLPHILKSQHPVRLHRAHITGHHRALWKPFHFMEEFSILFFSWSSWLWCATRARHMFSTSCVALSCRADTLLLGLSR